MYKLAALIASKSHAWQFLHEKYNEKLRKSDTQHHISTFMCVQQSKAIKLLYKYFF